MATVGPEILDHQQFLRLREFKPPFESFGGRVIQEISPGIPHSIIQTELCSRLNQLARPARLGRAFVELRTSFSDDSLVFDVSYFSKARLPRAARRAGLPRGLIAPVIAVEILSQGQTLAELEARLHAAIRHGARLGWLIRPRPEALTIYRPGRDPERLDLTGILTGEDVLPVFSLSLEEMFAWLEED
jgi:Uma2 family endonuclease